MSSPSNLYAEKIFAEHPIALWALDDKADYISLITEQNRALSSWDVSGGEVIANSWTSIVSNFGTSSIKTIVYGNNLWVAAGYSGQIRTSTDTITWITRTSNFVGTIESVAYGNGIWMAGASSNSSVRVSTDTITWTTQDTTMGSTLESIAYGNGIFLVSGYYGQMRTSTDTITWVTKNSNFGMTLIFSVAYGNGLWVAVGQNGQIRTSTDTTTWVTRTSNFGNVQIFSVAYADTLWVATGDFGNIRRSVDGISWITVSSEQESSIFSIAYGNGIWMAGGDDWSSVGEKPYLAKSANTATWTKMPNPVNTYPYSWIWSLAYGNNIWLAGGFPGIMYRWSAFANVEFSGEPFINSSVSEIKGNIPIGDSGQVICISPNLINLNQLDTNLETFSIGTYFYSDSRYIQNVELGYEYLDPDTAEIIQNLKTFVIPVTKKWVFLSESFKIPTNEFGIATSATPRIVMKINYIDGLSGLTPYDFIFFVNGVTFGQWSEEFNSSSLGSTPIPLPSDIALFPSDCLPATSYGLQELPGYYLINNNALTAKNSGMPLVYGASNITKILENGDQPSLIIPGLGFLNDAGKHNNYTLEMWLRIAPDTLVPKRIFGPISSDDGLYVDGPFLTLKIGDYVGSHFVGEWFRPMLLHIEFTKNTTSLLLNGEQVISLNYLVDDLPFPESINKSPESDFYQKSQDWLGFYSYYDTSPYEIDCVALYSYQVPEIVAKRRMVYGQGVEFPESLNTAYGGQSVLVDYPFAKYSNNYNYPDTGKWSQGLSENILSNNISITNNDYLLPEIVFENRGNSEWLIDSFNETLSYITLKPNSTWESTKGHILFENLEILNEKTAGIYGIFEVESLSATDQTLFEIVNEINGDSFSAILNDSKISFNFTYGGTSYLIFEQLGCTINTKFNCGIDIDKLSKYYGSDLASFFGKRNQLRLYVAGTKDLLNTYSGKIHKVGFTTKRNLNKIQNNFEENGICTLETTTEFLNHIASYTLVSKIYFNKYSLDISVDSYWEDYVPLSYFGKYVKDINNDDVYDLDFIQINLGYPSPETLKEILGQYYYDTDGQELKSYISFQYLQTGANASDSFFTNIESVPISGVINASNNWINTKYEFVNNMIIYPPTGVDFNDLAIVIHLEFQALTTKSKQIKIKSLQLASQTYSQTSPNPINTRFGLSVYPYKKSGVYFDYKAKNPFTIYKGSSPYLYLTKYSGFQLKGDEESMTNRGLSLPLNTNLSDDYKIIALQMSLMNYKNEFPEKAVEIFELQTANSYIKFMLEPVGLNRKRARIYAINANTGNLENGMAFYWNGNLVKNPVLTAQEWGILGISFAEIQSLDNATGAFRITGPLTINNISHYKSSGLQQAQDSIRREWLDVRASGSLEIDWSFWEANFIWQDVLVVNTVSFYGIDPSSLYKAYTGTNKIIMDDERPIILESYAYNVYKDIAWGSQTITPV